MKLTEFKKQQRIDEKLSNWVGNYGAAALQQLGNRWKGDTEGEMSVAQKMGKERFLNNFVAKAYATLNSEIQSGRVDPNLSGKQQPAQTTQATAAPAVQQPAAPAVQQPAAPAPQGQAMDLDAYKKRREAEKAAGVQSQQAAQQQMKQTAATNAATSAADTALVARVKAEKEKPGFQQDKGLLRQAAVKGIHEKKYQKLNSIFESLLTEAESVGQFLKRWIPTYMGRVNLNDPHTQTLIQKVEDTYGIDKGKAALTQLANAAYAASYAPGYGAGDEGDDAEQQQSTQRQPTQRQVQQPTQQPAQQGQQFDPYGMIIRVLDASKQQPNYAEMLKNLAAEIAKRQTPPPAPAAPAAPVSESRKKKRK